MFVRLPASLFFYTGLCRTRVALVCVCFDVWVGGLFLNVMSVFERREDTTKILSRKCPFSMARGQDLAKCLIVAFGEGRLTW